VPNDYFQFKQFRVKQDTCAMKVCTDSCILGAYADVAQAQTILDIGTGTGLLSLMAAQRTQAKITAIEIDPQAAQQAFENIQCSPWAERIQVKAISLQAFALANKEKYDVILCNPPFYKQSFKSPDQARNVAMHSHALSFADIIQFCSGFLAEKGKLFMLLPPRESIYFEQLAQAKELYIQAKLQIFTKIAAKHLRTIQAFGRTQATNVPEEILCIRQPDNTYTPEFTRLLKDYYLIF